MGYICRITAMAWKNTQISVLCMFVVLIDLSRCYLNDDPMCKDVTLGNCPIDENRVIQEIGGIPAEDCQAACLKYTNCIIYRFSTPTDSEPSHCQLLTYDYRQA